MVSSGVWAGKIPLEIAYNLKEVGGGTRTMKQELERIGYLGKIEASFQAMPMGVCYFRFPQGQASNRLRVTSNCTLSKDLDWKQITRR